MITPRQPKKLHSYKQQRLKSSRKGLSQSMAFTRDIEELQSVMKLSANRRSSGNLNTLRLSLKRELSESFSISSPPLTESDLRLSNVNNRFISKYMDRDSNIVEVSEEEPIGLVLTEKSMSTNVLVKPRRKVEQIEGRKALKDFKDLKERGAGVTASMKNFSKLAESRLVQKVVKKKGIMKDNLGNKVEVGKIIKKVEILSEEIDKLELGCGKQILHQLQAVINRLRQQC